MTDVTVEHHNEPGHETPAVIVLEQPLTPEHVQDIAEAASNDAEQMAQEAHETAQESAALAQEAALANLDHGARIDALETTTNERLARIESALEQWNQNLMNQSQLNNQNVGVDQEAQETETVDIVPQLPTDNQPMEPRKRRIFLKHP